MIESQAKLSQIGKRILEALEMDPVTAARELNIHYKTLWRYIHGNTPPSLWFLLKISERTGKSVDWLLKGDDSATVKDKEELNYLQQIRQAKTLRVAEEIKGFIRFKLHEAEKNK